MAVGLRASKPTAAYQTGFQVLVQEYLLKLINDGRKPIWREHPRFGTESKYRGTCLLRAHRQRQNGH
jgi:hypothetical protein